MSSWPFLVSSTSSDRRSKHLVTMPRQCLARANLEVRTREIRARKTLIRLQEDCRRNFAEILFFFQLLMGSGCPRYPPVTSALCTTSVRALHHGVRAIHHRCPRYPPSVSALSTTVSALSTRAFADRGGVFRGPVRATSPRASALVACLVCVARSALALLCPRRSQCLSAPDGGLQDPAVA